jgi:hypothetical protein
MFGSAFSLTRWLREFYTCSKTECSLKAPSRSSVSTAILRATERRLCFTLPSEKEPNFFDAIWRDRVVPAQILVANKWTIRSDAPNIGDNGKPLIVEIHTN